MSKIDTFHVISGLYGDFPNFIFTDIDASNSVLGSFFAFFFCVRKSDLKHVSITDLNPDFLFDLFYLVT